MNQFKGPMFLQAHYTQADASDTARTQYGARTAANDFAPALGNRAAAAPWRSRAGRKASTAAAFATAPSYDFAVIDNAAQAQKSRRAGSLLSQLWYLGGRPMHAGHNLDLDEPFDVATTSAAHQERRRGDRRLSSCHLQPQTCNG